VYKQFTKNQSLLLCSTNPEYAPYEVNVNEISEVWKFINYISSEMPEPNLSRDNLSHSVMNMQKELREIKNTLKVEQL